MRVLVLGALGMLGHQVCRLFSATHETWATVRSDRDLSFAKECLPDVQILSGVDAINFSTIEDAIRKVIPDVVVNCIGIIKQDGLASDPIPSITVNALTPHLIARICSEIGTRFIHVSTDCVFTGAKGGYTESDASDAYDLYGQTKLLGEVNSPDALTIRTSIIGSELKSSRSLLDWFLSQSGDVSGYTNAIFSGFTTLELSRIIVKCTTDWNHLTGLYQVSAEPISKFDLLTLVNQKFDHGANILPVHEPKIDRSLDSTRFREITGYRPPSWDEMISELAIHSTSTLLGGYYVSTR